MEHNRRGEDGSVPFRSGRYFTVDSAWFFACREGFDQGPYRTKVEAKIALASYLQDCVFGGNSSPDLKEASS